MATSPTSSTGFRPAVAHPLDARSHPAGRWIFAAPPGIVGA